MPEFEPVVKSFTQEDINRYADAVGDHNPIHVDEEFAKQTEFGGTILHGTLVAAGINELMTKELGTDWLERGSFDIRFKAPARPGDTITTQASPSGDKFRVECRNQDGVLLV